jgi:hypothetical protein
LTPPEIDAILADQEFFQPYLKNALVKRAELGHVPESPLDATDCNAIFFLTELEDTSIIPDLLKCLRMSEKDLRVLYGDSMTEHLWLPFAKLGSTYLEDLWGFVTDTSVYLFSRHAAVAGVVAMHHFQPDSRTAAVAFVERLLTRDDCFPVDHLASILCDCADSGLTELTDRAEAFASTMEDDQEHSMMMATADDVLRIFERGPRKDFITGRAHNVYGVNKQWQKWDEAGKKNKNDDELQAMEDEDESEEFLDTKPSKPKQIRIGRNDPCPCGSGKKYKKCHGM